MDVIVWVLGFVIGVGYRVSGFLLLLIINLIFTTKALGREVTLEDKSREVYGFAML